MESPKLHMCFIIPAKRMNRELRTAVSQQWGDDVFYTGVGLQDLSVYNSFSGNITDCVVVSLQRSPTLSFYNEIRHLTFRIVLVKVLHTYLATSVEYGKRTIYVVRMKKGTFAARRIELLSIMGAGSAAELFANYAQMLFRKAEKKAVPYGRKGPIEIYHTSDNQLLDDHTHEYYACMAFTENAEICTDTIEKLNAIRGVIDTIGFISE